MLLSDDCHPFVAVVFLGRQQDRHHSQNLRISIPRCHIELRSRQLSYKVKTIRRHPGEWKQLKYLLCRARYSPLISSAPLGQR